MRKLSHWNYRVLQAMEDHFVIIEVYYHKDRIVGWTESSKPAGSDLNDLKGDLTNMKKALAQPVLTYSDLPGKNRRTGSMLSYEDADRIRQLFDDGMTQSQLAIRFDVHQGTISRVVRGVTHPPA